MVFEISLSHHNTESLELTKALSIAEARCQGARQKRQVRRLELLLLGGGVQGWMGWGLEHLKPPGSGAVFLFPRGILEGVTSEKKKHSRTLRMGAETRAVWP